MSKLTEVRSAVGRALAWLLPAGRRDWIAAIWAEAHEVPPGLARLAWRAGGLWVLAREALRPRRLGRAALFAAAASVAVWVAWPRPWVGHVAEGRFNAIAPVLLLAVLPLLSLRLFGPAGPSRLARAMRVLCCAAVLALVPAFTFLLVRNMLAPTRPAYLHIFCGGQGCAGVAAALTGRRCRGPDGARLPYTVRVGQGVAAGVLANGIAAMFTTVLGTGAILLVLRFPSLMYWVDHGRHLTAVATYRYELNTENNAGGYALMLMSFPVIGLFVGYLAAVIANPAPLDARSPSPGLPMTSGE